MTSSRKRVAFMFDERSLTTLQEMTGKGFTKIIVRNSETENEQVLIIPSLSFLHKRFLQGA